MSEILFTENIDVRLASDVSTQTMKEALVPRPIHPFPARMAASVAWDELESSKKRLVVLDPMSGSGTSLAVAARLGHTAHGVDVDPLAVLTARVWTSGVEKDDLVKRARQVLERAKKRGGPLPTADAETRAFLSYWFDATNRRQLSALARAIGAIRETTMREALWCAFSRMIITKQGGVSCAMDLAHSRPHKVRDRAAVRAFDIFIEKVEQLGGLLPGRVAGRARVEIGDARKLRMRRRSVDRVITSPPYLNAIDYLRTSKFSLVWMGHSIPELRQIRARSIGTEVGGKALPDPDVMRIVRRVVADGVLTDRQSKILGNYVRDLDAVIGEVSRVLRPTGAALFVVGESSTRGVMIQNSKAIGALAKRHGLRVQSTRRRELPPNRRYLPPPTTNGSELDQRMAYEVLLRLVPNQAA